MTIAHISMFYYPMYGGQETYIQALNNIFEANRIDVRVIQPKYSDLRNKPANVYYVPAIPFFKRFSWFWFNLMIFLSKKLKRESLINNDILISHYAIHYPVLRWHSKVIVVSHGVDWPNHPTTFFDKTKKKIAEGLLKDRCIIVANDTEFLRMIGLNITAQQKFFEEIQPGVWFIPNCIDIEKFKFLKMNREKVILVPRNIRKSRGVHLAIEAFKLIHEKYPDFIMKIIGGPLKGRYYEYCKDLIRQYSLEENINFCGHILNEKMVDIYNLSLVTLIPTISFEGTSISALESMACKTPVVSTNIGGLKDLPTYKVETTARSICNGLSYVIDNYETESEKQFTVTRKIFNTSNWSESWLKVINVLANTNTNG